MPTPPPRSARRIRLGWLGPLLVALGAAVAGLAVWFMVTSRPRAGREIDRVQIDAHSAFVVRAEAGGSRSFLELVTDDRVQWQAIIPPYAGRPGASGIAWSKTAVTVRVTRNQRPEVFALAMRDASKLGGYRLAQHLGPVIATPRGPITLTDHERSYELVIARDGSELVAIDLTTGEPVWRQDLGRATFDAGGVGDGVVWLGEGASRRAFRARDGAPVTSPNHS